jgi:hypothetical protein
MVILPGLLRQAIDEISGNLAPIMDRKQDINALFHFFVSNAKRVTILFNLGQNGASYNLNRQIGFCTKKYWSFHFPVFFQ